LVLKHEPNTSSILVLSAFVTSSRQRFVIAARRRGTARVFAVGPYTLRKC
jgi:hypothetical protein